MTEPEIAEAALSFSPAGEKIGEVDADAYRAGSREAGIAYLVRLERVVTEAAHRTTPNLRIVIEHPAAAREGRRQRLEFVTASP